MGQFCNWGGSGWRLTFSDFVDCDGVEVYGLGVWAQCSASVAEEVFTNLGLPGLLEVCVVSVSTASRLIELNDGDGIIVRGLVAIKAADHVTM